MLSGVPNQDELEKEKQSKTERGKGGDTSGIQDIQVRSYIFHPILLIPQKSKAVVKKRSLARLKGAEGM